MSTTLRIVESPGNTLVAEIPEYDGPVPRPGEYIYHPGFDPDADPAILGVMSVKTVTYHILGRQDGAGHFVGRTSNPERSMSTIMTATSNYLIEVHV
jgi:hypothetical protein